jgi:hypothetical protein
MVPEGPVVEAGDTPVTKGADRCNAVVMSVFVSVMNTPVTTLASMFQRTVPNRDHMALDRDAPRNAGDLPKRHEPPRAPQAG